MSLRPVILTLLSTLTLAGCASPNLDLVPIPSTEGPAMVSNGDVARLKVQVQNLGSVPSESSPVAIEFFLRKVTVTSIILDGGRLEPGQASRVLEFEMPQECTEAGCEFQVSVDPEKQLMNENRSNNRARGRCEGEVASKYVPTIGTPKP